MTLSKQEIINFQDFIFNWWRNNARDLPWRPRFFRGRIMDLVREREWKETALLQEMVKRHGKDVQFYEKIMEKLLQEGLLARSPSAIISLPE